MKEELYNLEKCRRGDCKGCDRARCASCGDLIKANETAQEADTSETKRGKIKMIDSIRNEKIGGAYTMQREITLSVADLRAIGGKYEIMALDHDGNELDCTTANSEGAALVEFNKLVDKYAGPLQKAVNAAGLIPGHKYTLVYLNDFGFPIAQKITFDGMTFTIYAQHSDVVKLVFTPYRKRSKYSKQFYNCSLMIFDGWQDMNESTIKDTLKDDGQIKITQSKYSCFSVSYIEDLERVFEHPVLIYKDYKQGVNGKMYA